jgi:hypothetical protein
MIIIIPLMNLLAQSDQAGLKEVSALNKRGLVMLIVIASLKLIGNSTAYNLYVIEIDSVDYDH